MSEICLDCLNKALGTDDTKRKYILSPRPDLCECCSKMKPVVIRMRRFYIALDICREAAENIRSYPERLRRK